ncbi:Molybdopterin synthase sulfur carrier subunit [Polaribacter huanghezhanensis]|uniref:MoaD/ThiS family protein n=1 Tax=Polaribacter huanghezhanensis TaxID=1354726 RepID=UPI002647AF95|nr:MoaD/ThiS family protein [Polaribacter huanghezhanensis]WKD85640.1 Molybdopterin synthase sulfur carrier subunit [Polaribacter huanghezhanensis]
MMKIQVLLFGIATDLLQTSSLEFEVSENCTIAGFKKEILSKYPQLEKINSYAIAVNETYASDEKPLHQNDVVAIIPPVSGG